MLVDYRMSSGLNCFTQSIVAYYSLLHVDLGHIALVLHWIANMASKFQIIVHVNDFNYLSEPSPW